MMAEQQHRQQQWQAVQAGELRKRLEQHQQQLEQQRQQRAEQGLPSTSTTGGGSMLEQQQAGDVSALDTAEHVTAAAGVGAGGIDAAAAEAAGREAAAAAQQQQNGTPLPSATEVAAYLDKLLTGKVAIKPAGQLGQRAASEVGGSSGGGSGPHKGWLRRVAGKLRQRESSMPNASLTASASHSGAVGGSSTGAWGSAGGAESAVVQKRAGLVGRGEAPLMHIEARHAQAERAAKEMVEAALLQQGIEAYRYVEG
jgi:hypothetical protein